MANLQGKHGRILSIDVLRALTMFFMIFVNDLWRISAVPKWLLHTKTNEDGMGFSDVIFPLFLFIVGLSIPLAISIRIRKQRSSFSILRHVLARSLALIVMGLFMVNYQSIFNDALPFSKHVWQILMAIGIVLIWLDYNKLNHLNKKYALIFKCIGILILMYLAFIYKGGNANETTWMKPHWWGILGLIGWAYLFNATLYLLFRKHIIVIGSCFILLFLLNIQEFNYFQHIPSFKIVVSASNHMLVMGGVLSTALYMHFKEKNQINKFLVLISSFGLLFIVLGFTLRPFFILSKNLATPSWTTICIGIGLLLMALLYLIIDQFKFKGLANSISPAGTSTLTCYLIPYFIYPIMALVDIKLSYFLTTGMTGILSSLLFSWAIIQGVGYFEKKNIRLKI